MNSWSYQGRLFIPAYWPLLAGTTYRLYRLRRDTAAAGQLAPSQASSLTLTAISLYIRAAPLSNSYQYSTLVTGVHDYHINLSKTLTINQTLTLTLI